ncbi:MAG: Unknown protein [uncultured Sulfurovum sp.]|uniref:CHAT domain-containing protein n=1 Tax=uncultured Sulfurovum sp. TaxID=269237 RepID=A0A6S6T6F7_9BACT|nr:MAG: Unknown protein [uncultured Sulfurovum sp.]
MQYFIHLLVLIFFMACSSSSISPNSIIKDNNFDISKMYEGHSFDVYINNEKVVFSESSSKLKSLDRYKGSKRSITWKLEKSILGDISINIEAIDKLKSYIGYLKPNAFEVALFPLQKVQLNSKKQEEAREDVLVNSSPLLTQINLLENNHLPEGEYVLRVKVRGTENWDRKEIYFKVEDKQNKIQSRGVYAPFAWYTMPLGKHKNSHLTQSTTMAMATSKDHKKLESLNKSLTEYKEKRDFSTALLYQNKLINYYENVEGENHIASADMYNNKALLHKDLGEYDEALKYNQKSLDIKLKYYPEKYDAISINYDNMGIIYYSMGKYAEAIKFFKKSLQLREEHFSSNPSLADSYNNLAIAFQDIGNHKEALVNLKKALKIRKQTVGEESETTASVYSAMGSTYESLKRYEKAMVLHEKSIAIHERILKDKPKTEALASAYSGMGSLHIRLNNYQEAINYYMKVLEIRQSIIKTKSLNLSEVYNNIGVSYMNLNQFEKSEKYLEKAIEVKEEVLGSKSNALQKEYKNLGWLYFRNKAYKKAYVYAKKSVEILLSESSSYFSALDALEYEHFIKSNEDQMDLLFQCTYYLGDKKSYEDSFSYWLAYKGAMLENQNRMTALYSQGQNIELKNKVEKLLKYKRALSRLYQSKVEERSANNLALQIKEYEENVSTLKEELSLKTRVINIDFESLVAKLASEQLYIDFSRIGNHYFGFAVDSKGKIFFRRISVENTKKIDKYILSFRKEMKDSLQTKRAESKKQLIALYDMLLKTLLETLTVDKKELIISADGLLRLLPFEVLFSTKQQQYLIEYKQVQYIPSGREFYVYRQLRDLKTTVMRLLFLLIQSLIKP